MRITGDRRIGRGVEAGRVRTFGIQGNDSAMDFKAQIATGGTSSINQALSLAAVVGGIGKQRPCGQAFSGIGMEIRRGEHTRKALK